MRIVHLVWGLGIGGIQTMLVDIANEQVKNHQVAIVVVNDIVDEGLTSKLNKRIKLVLISRRPGSRSYLPIIKLNFILRLFHPDIIHCHEDRLTKLIVGTICPLIRTIHNTHSCSEEYPKFRKLCCISQSVRDYTASQGFHDGVVVYNGIHTEDIIKRSLPFPAKGELYKCVCVGRLHPMKGQNVLIEAFNVLINQKGVKEVSLDLIGDGESKENLQALVYKYGLDSYIHFLGGLHREVFYPKLKDYDLFVLPSVSEGFGLTLAEACAARIPVISCDLEGPMEVIANGSYGMSFKTGDASALADAMVNHIKQGTNIEQVEMACNYVRTHYDVTITAAKYVEQYMEVLK